MDLKNKALSADFVPILKNRSYSARSDLAIRVLASLGLLLAILLKTNESACNNCVTDMISMKTVWFLACCGMRGLCLLQILCIRSPEIGRNKNKKNKTTNFTKGFPAFLAQVSQNLA